MAMLMTKKTVDKFGSRLNETAGSAVSSFARRQMEKFGWSEGKGLGKREDGISNHIKSKKRLENSGLGSEPDKVEPEADDWWHHGFNNALKKVPKEKKKKKSKRKRTDDDDEPPSFEKLFAATGGKRLGMRARASQNGKLARTMDNNTIEADESKGSNGQSNEDITKDSISKSNSERDAKKKAKKKKSSKDE